ncbi:imidazole glycerol phosphate synthase subunit HisH [Prochlorococcus sp. MIT 1300]|uniref:imidazole glycerol phosphate synthase subunit HisH n=1 Tax=Prochlorococcus sp. MIT 1300 TaxID=3096218 RepID=UPI002A7602F8|nr:imidazole glycerol phosphate synthase subunit HisH [Prochlorococcus sp. MIT 1300]
MTQIGLIDYGMGNLHSVRLAFKRLKRELKLVNSQADLKFCDALVLPGVGSFDPAVHHLNQTGLIPSIRSWAKEDKPLLGICLGLQLLFESSDEGVSPGLGILKGHVQKLPNELGERIPHMGWSPLNQVNKSPLLDKHEQNCWMYFVHSYSAIPSQKEVLAATAKFGKKEVTSIVWKSRIGACQFHPEKSAKAGQRMLHKWLQWLENGAKPPN